MARDKRFKLPRDITKDLYKVADAENIEPLILVKEAFNTYGDLMTMLNAGMKIIVEYKGEQQIWLNPDLLHTVQQDINSSNE